MSSTVVSIGATTLWDPWDASRPAPEITGTECIWSPPTAATGCRFSLCTVGRKLAVLPQTSQLDLKLKERRVVKGMGETWVEQ